MDLSRPGRCVIASLHFEVLGVLAATTAPITGRQVQRLVRGGASQSGVRAVLLQLVRTGVVDVVEAGSANLYTLNRDHVAANAVIELIDLRGLLFERIRTALASWSTPPLRAAVFGSAARADGDENSDIDLFVVRPEVIAADDPGWMDDAAALNAAIRRWSGNAGSIVEATPTQVRAMIARDEPIIAELGRDQVDLVGSGSVLDVELVSR